MPLVKSLRPNKHILRNTTTYFVAAFVLLVLVMPLPGCQPKQLPVVYGDNPEAGHYAAINGIKLYYELYGNGNPLVLLHGNGASISSVSEQVRFFSDHYKVIAIDSRGQGKSTDLSDSLTYEMMASDVNGLLDYLHLDSAYIIGHSDGGIIGLITAFRHPAKVKMLAAMSPNTRPDSAVLYPAVEKQAVMELARYEDSLKAGHKEITDRLKLLRLMQYHPHISAADLAAIKAPVMVLSGDRDVIRLSHIIEIFRAIPRANLCVLPGTTHFAPLKDPVAYNETIERFFRRPFIMPDKY